MRGVPGTFKRKLPILLNKQRSVKNSRREKKQVDHECCNPLYRGHASPVAGGSQTSERDGGRETGKPRRSVRDRQIRSAHRNLAHLGQSATNFRSRRTTRRHLGGFASVFDQPGLLICRRHKRLVAISKHKNEAASIRATPRSNPPPAPPHTFPPAPRAYGGARHAGGSCSSAGWRRRCRWDSAV